MFEDTTGKKKTCISNPTKHTLGLSHDINKGVDLMNDKANRHLFEVSSVLFFAFLAFDKS